MSKRKTQVLGSLIDKKDREVSRRVTSSLKKAKETNSIPKKMDPNLMDALLKKAEEYKSLGLYRQMLLYFNFLSAVHIQEIKINMEILPDLEYLVNFAPVGVNELKSIFKSGVEKVFRQLSLEKKELFKEIAKTLKEEWENDRR